MNFKTIEENNENNLIENLSSNLSINRSSIRCEIKGNQVDEKYSVSHKEMRTYNHRLYEVSISNFPEIMRNDNFMLNGKHYYWMSIDDMRIVLVFFLLFFVFVVFFFVVLCFLFVEALCY